MANAPRMQNVFGARLSRRQFVKAGGALVVGVGVLGLDGWKTVARTAGKNELDPTLPASWIEIHADNTILIRTGRCDFGQSTIPVAYRQIVAEELCVPYEAITAVVSGDTDRTPDGGPSVDLLGRGAPNMRKAAAYTYQALLDSLRITEVMYQPVAATSAGDYEYVELQNIGATTLDLGGVRFTNGIDYTFPSGTTLAGGAFIVVAKNRTAYLSRYPSTAALLAPDAFTGSLDNSGETLALTLP